MDLKKFKKLTNDETKIRKIVSYSFLSAFDYLLVIKVVNYYTLDVVIFNNKVLNKWRFYLYDVNALDDKLSIENKEYLRNKLSELCLNRYFRFNLKKAKFQELMGNIYFDDKELEKNSSVNTMMVNMIINLTILKEKLRKNSKKIKGEFEKRPSPLKKSYSLRQTSLTTIKEEDECNEFFDCEI